MSFVVWVALATAEPSVLPVSDQKVIRHILDVESKRVSSSTVGGTSSNQSEDSIEQYLLGPKDESKEKEIRDRDPASFSWWWAGVGFLLLLAGLIQFIWGKRKDPINSLNVLSRTFFGKEGSIVVVEVQDSEKNNKRFLLGLNGGSAPTFLADLSSPIGFPDLIPVEPTFDDSPPPKEEKRRVRKNPRTIRKKEAPTAKGGKDKGTGPSLDILVGESKESEKEELVEEILRLRESKPLQTEKGKEKKDKWTEGFNEIFRK